LGSAVSLGALGLVAWTGCTSSSASSTPPTTIPDPAAIAQGSYLVNSLIGCGDCHTSDPKKPFAGGVKYPIDQQGHFVFSRNLTPDPTTGMKLTEDQFVTMMQTGADFRHQGQLLFVMPWPNFRWMTTDDLKAIYAFLKVLPPIVNAVPDDDKGPAAAQGPVPLPTMYDEGEEPRPLPPAHAPNLLGPPEDADAPPDPGHAVLGAALLPLAYAKMANFASRSAEEQASFGRGSYLVNAAACSDCHTNQNGAARNYAPGPSFLQIATADYLTGGLTFTDPPAFNALLGQTRSMSQNLIGVSGYFNQPDTTYLTFAAEMDTISHASDTPPLSLGWPMPAAHLRTLVPQDLQDIYTYMKILAEDYDHTGQADKQTQDPARYCTTSADCSGAAGVYCFVDSSSPATVGNQCLAKTCTTAADCDACQTCGAAGCQAPAATDACLTTGM
jgi:mono/diheme cytochrome c family protein